MTWTLTGGTKCTNGPIILFDLKKLQLAKLFRCKHSEPLLCSLNIILQKTTSFTTINRSWEETHSKALLWLLQASHLTIFLKSIAALWQLAIEAWKMGQFFWKKLWRFFEVGRQQHQGWCGSITFVAAVDTWTGGIPHHVASSQKKMTRTQWWELQWGFFNWP